MTSFPPLSILDLAFVTEGSDARTALDHAVDLARHAEQWGYTRFWLAEHHNMVGIASAATAVVVGHVAGHTKTIRVGSGGIMLPNHSPLVIAEQFGTLEALYPGRIDLGLGRAPGTDQNTMKALRRSMTHAENFPRDLAELLEYLGPLQPDQVVQAVPGTGSGVPVWILGSSLFGAQLAARMGLPYAFASHFAPGDLMHALEAYRRGFQPSKHLAEPHVMVGVNVVVADSDAEAKRLFPTPQQSFTNLLRGTRGKLRPPLDNIDNFWSAQEKAHVSSMLSCSFVGSETTVRHGLERFLEATQADELMVVTALYDHQARLRSYESLSKLTRSAG